MGASAYRFLGVLEVAFERFGLGSRTKPRSALVLLLRLALVAPWLVSGRLSELTLFGLGSGCGVLESLGVMAHAPALLS
ncbi:hypothetical protein AUO94_03985 [Planococcus kocurii]|uniref:Uncharacterized protein n=1 Tax=Planococcus kocurii TaxID=1374 RepID=A0ABN4JWM7_9BACL|nr:hypothetical protein AUO94_03985 [Planococcus kocurii]